MGIIEAQYSRKVFAASIMSEFQSMTLPMDKVDALLQGALFDSFNIIDVTFPDTDTSGVAAPAGTLLVNIDLQIEATTRALAKQSPGKKPLTTPIPVSVLVRIAGSPNGAFLKRTVDAVLDGAGNPLDVTLQLAPSKVPPPGKTTTIFATWIGKTKKSIVVKLATLAGQTIPDVPLINRTATGRDWVVYLSGDYLAETTTTTLAQSFANVTPKVLIKHPVASTWQPTDEMVVSSGTITAPDSCPNLFSFVFGDELNPDFDVDISAQSHFTFQADPIAPAIVATLRLTWSLDTWDVVRCVAVEVGSLAIISTLGGAADVLLPVTFIGALGAVAAVVAVPLLAQSTATDKFTSNPPPVNTVVVDSGDHHVTYRSTTPVVAPKLYAATTTTVDMSVGDDGVTLFGPMKIKQPTRTLDVAAYDPWFTGSFSCDAGVWTSYFEPGGVIASGSQNLRLFDASVEPSDVWQLPGLAAQQAKPGGIVLDVLPIADEPEPGSTAGVLVQTSLGVRWVELQPVPAPPPQPSEQALHEYQLACDVEQNAPGIGSTPPGWFNPKWKIDPPVDPTRGFRNWGFVFDHLPAGTTVSFGVVADDGREHRPRDVVVVDIAERHGLAQLIVTRAHERVVVRVTGRTRTVTAPRTYQQWLHVVGGASLVNGARRGGGELTAMRHGATWTVVDGGRALSCVPGRALTQRAPRTAGNA